MVQPCPAKPVSTTDSAVWEWMLRYSSIPLPGCCKLDSTSTARKDSVSPCWGTILLLFTHTNKMVILEGTHFRRWCLSHPRQLIPLQLPTSSSCEIHVNRREEEAIREAQSHVPIILSHICRVRKLKSKHKSMLTKRSNYFHTKGKPLADRKELCSPLHAFIWLLLVMQEGKKKKKKSLFPKVHRTAEATHHLWERRRAHSGLRACRALLIGPSVNIQ